MRITPEERRRLAGHIEARQAELGLLRLEDVAAAAGISVKTLYSVREGAVGIPPRTVLKLERGLRWEPGSCQAIIDGGQPTPVRPEPQASDMAAVLFPGDDVAQRIWRLDLPVDEREREIAGWRRVQAAGPVDEVVSAIWLRVHKPDVVRLREIAGWRQVQGESSGTAAGLLLHNE